MLGQKWSMKKLAQLNIENVYHHHHSRQPGKGFCRSPLTTVLILSLVTPVFFFSTYQRNFQAQDDARAVDLAAEKKLVRDDSQHARPDRWNDAEQRQIRRRGTLGMKQDHDESSWAEDDETYDDGGDHTKQKDQSALAQTAEGKAALDHPVGGDNGETESVPKETHSEDTGVVDETTDPLKRRDMTSGDQDGKDQDAKEDEDKTTDAAVDTVPPDGAVTTTEGRAVAGPPAAAVVQVTTTDVTLAKDTAEDYKASLISRIQGQVPLADELMEFARERENTPLLNHLQFVKDQCVQGVEKLTDGSMDIESGNNVLRVAELATLRARELRSSTIIIEKMRKELQESRDKMRILTKERNILDLVATKSLPKGLHCLSMQLTIDYYNNTDSEPIDPSPEVLEDNSRCHYALFSDNVLAASVVVKSLVHNAKDPSRHVIHLVTDAMNKPAMIAWFRRHPPHPAVIDIKAVEDFSDWLTPDHCPVLRFLQESKTLINYYSKLQGSTTNGGNEEDEKGIKHRNPKYLSMLNHLRFYLPEVYPKLKRVVFLDEDIVVQKDLAPLWDVDLEGNVNGAVFTCRGKFHRLGHYLNFSHPDIKREFEEDACGWAYGMNVFDLDRWREQNLTEVYHKWQIAVRLLMSKPLFPAITFLKRSLLSGSLGERLDLKSTVVVVVVTNSLSAAGYLLWEWGWVYVWVGVFVGTESLVHAKETAPQGKIKATKKISERICMRVSWYERSRREQACFLI
ncbi:GT8-family glycosyltransferase [Chara braunii]|uniref:GT8-family glycosyltransferase n=1 Tax=Chara braunii TaxID=69332 RepID=A0A388KF24_CHABU|nr:GT8-family glycosyltransferase [Chara braunii]|eukprot:GBG68650.1 GT8-family glycosyltransferase [Chara braunii]